MSEQEELAKLEAKKQKIEMKYAKIAKQYLHEINEIFDPSVSFIDMNKTQFKAYATEHFNAEKIDNRNAERLQKLSDLILKNYQNTDQLSFLSMNDKNFDSWCNELQNVMSAGFEYRNEHRND